MDKEQESTSPLSQVLLNPSNTFTIENPEDVPTQTIKLQEHLLAIMKSKNMSQFRHNAQEWASYLNSNGYEFDQIAIRIKPLSVGKGQLDEKDKYSLHFYPVFRKLAFNWNIGVQHYKLSAQINNITKDWLKSLEFVARWNRIERELSFSPVFKFYSAWQFELRQTYGTPLNNKWVTDSREGILKYHLKKKELSIEETGTVVNNSLYWKLKGYEPRLKRNQGEEGGIYADRELIKKQDIFETGFDYSKTIIPSKFSYVLRAGVGSDYYSTHFIKLKSRMLKKIDINNKVGVRSLTEFCALFGKNLPQQEMFSRNQNKWMGERSQIYGLQRLDVYARGISFLNTYRTTPSNYVSVWASKSYENKLKMEAELGVSFFVLDHLRFDIKLLRLSGVKGEPRFGLKFDF